LLPHPHPRLVSNLPVHVPLGVVFFSTLDFRGGACYFFRPRGMGIFPFGRPSFFFCKLFGMLSFINKLNHSTSSMNHVSLSTPSRTLFTFLPAYMQRRNYFPSAGRSSLFPLPPPFKPDGHPSTPHAVISPHVFLFSPAPRGFRPSCAIPPVFVLDSASTAAGVIYELFLMHPPCVKTTG